MGHSDWNEQVGLGESDTDPDPQEPETVPDTEPVPQLPVEKEPAPKE